MLTKFRCRRISLMLVSLVCLAGCSSSDNTTEKTLDPSGNELTPVSVQLNWYPEVEHGGVYQASVDGTFQQAGLTVEIRPGGRETPVAPELLRGRSQFAITNADDVVLFRAQGADIVAVLAAVQMHPRCILVREDSGVKSFDDLAGMTLQRQPGRSFLSFLRKRGHLDGVREVPYFNSIAAMVEDPKIAVQAYCNAEPLLAQQQGLKVRSLMVSDLGWNPYSSVLVTSGDMIRESPELVKKFVLATQAGWEKYLASPGPANEAILAANQHGMTQEALQFGSEQLRILAKGKEGDIPVGQMLADRWDTLVTQMKELEIVEESSVVASECFTTEFLQIDES